MKNYPRGNTVLFENFLLLGNWTDLFFKNYCFVTNILLFLKLDGKE